MEEPQIRNSTSQEDMLEKDEMPSDSDLKNQYNEPSLEREDDDSEVPENTEPKISQMKMNKKKLKKMKKMRKMMKKKRKKKTLKKNLMKEIIMLIKLMQIIKIIQKLS